MKKLLIMLLLPVALQAQKMPEYDRNKVRITEPGRTIIAHTSTDKATVSYHDRLYFWYGGNTIHQTQGGFSGHLLTGLYQEFYPDRSLREEGEFKDGLKDGVWKSWAADGVLKEYATWKEGQKDGVFEVYLTDGHLAQRGKYKNNLLHGKISNFKGGDSVQVLRYKKGKLVIKDGGKETLWQRVKNFRFKKKKTPQATR